MTKCLFCKIASHDITATIRYEDDAVIAFDDIHPVAPIHILIVPKQHITGIETVASEDHTAIMAILHAAQELIGELNLGGEFKLAINGPAVRHVDHLHFHLLNRKTASVD